MITRCSSDGGPNLQTGTRVREAGGSIPHCSALITPRLNRPAFDRTNFEHGRESMHLLGDVSGTHFRQHFRGRSAFGATY